MNKVILLGRLSKKPEIRLKDDNKVALFTLAVNRRYVKQGEEMQVDFLNIVTFGKLAEFAEKYLKLGLQICVVGRLQTRNYTDKNGAKKYVTEVISDEIYFADSLNKLNNEDTLKPVNNYIEENIASENFSENDDDLPF